MGSTTVNEANVGEQQKVELRRVIRASRERVFQAWTKPESLGCWFGPGAIRMERAVMDVRTGGKYRIELRGTADGNPEHRDREVSVEGQYIAVIPNEMIRFTWKPKWNPGEESEVTVKLRDVEGGTELVLTHERFATLESRNGHSQGWTSSLNKLEAYLHQ